MAYQAKGLYWFKWQTNATEDPAVDELLSECGAAGMGVMVQVFSTLHDYGNRRCGHPSVDYVVRRVARDLYSEESNVMETCEMMAALGLLDAELWDEGKVANEHASADIIGYWAKADAGRYGAEKQRRERNVENSDAPEAPESQQIDKTAGR